VQCVRFINGLANFTLKNQVKSHRAQKGYQITLVELQNFLNDVVTNSPELGNMRSSAGPSAQPTRKRNLEDPLVDASKIWKRNGGGRGRGVDVDVEATMVDVVKHMAALTSTLSQMR
jgi:hypothetical protein